MGHRQQPEHAILGADGEATVGGLQTLKNARVANHHAFALAGGARGEAQVGRAGGGELPLCGGVEAGGAARLVAGPTCAVASIAVGEDTNARLLLLYQRMEMSPPNNVRDGAGRMVLRNRHHAGACGQNRERRLNELDALGHDHADAPVGLDASGRYLGRALPRTLDQLRIGHTPPTVLDDGHMIGLKASLLGDALKNVHRGIRCMRTAVRTNARGTCMAEGWLSALGV